MALLTVNGHALIRGEIRLPRVGVWSADLKIDTLTTFGVGGPVTIASADGKFSLKGVAYREGIYTNTLTMRAIGGAGGLAPPPGGVGQNLPAKAYRGTSLGLVVGDMLQACGEQLSQTSDPSVLAIPLARWTRIAGPGKRALAQLLSTVATSWRTLPDGTVWIGTDTYPPAPRTQFDLLDRHFGDGLVVIGSQQPFASPGTLVTLSVAGVTFTENVSNVVHRFHDDSIRSELWFERSGTQS